MKMNSDVKWLRKKAAQEDGCYVSAGADHIPPSEAELEAVQGKIDFVLRTHSLEHASDSDLREVMPAWLNVTLGLITEIRRLRALCGRAEPSVRASVQRLKSAQLMEDRRAFADELRDASEGKL